MSIIFVGSIVDRRTLKTLPDASVAGNKMQLGFVNGFSELGIDIRAISVEAHGMWRMNHKPIFVKGKVLQEGMVSITTISYVNLPGIKQISIICNLKRNIKKLVKSEKNTNIIVYNTMSIFANPALWAKRKYGLKVIAIIADLPIKMKKNIFQKFEDRMQVKVIKKFSSLITLTRHIGNDFASQVQNYVIEAGCNPEDYLKSSLKEKKKIKKEKSIVFSGTLNELSGIDLVIDAMGYIKNKYIKLHIYGDGPCRSQLIETIQEKDNVIYHGRVTNEEMIKIQQFADLLVCPRKTDDFTTRYTFPSKILEYICAGVPVLSNRLPGIPEEYEKYINFSDLENPKDWAYMIEKILYDNSYVDKAQKARDEVLEKKSWKYQCKNLMEFLDIQ